MRRRRATLRAGKERVWNAEKISLFANDAEKTEKRKETKLRFDCDATIDNEIYDRKNREEKENNSQGSFPTGRTRTSARHVIANSLVLTLASLLAILTVGAVGTFYIALKTCKRSDKRGHMGCLYSIPSETDLSILVRKCILR